MKNTEKEMDSKKAQEILNKARQKQVDDCVKAVNEALEIHNCTFDVTAKLSARGSSFDIQIIPKA